ncbi:MAG TPA: PAS domain-containing protein [Phycisphaerae bacterium]|nr:PAS domain-containing protein [Phycisphaerae bacterium]HPP26394.1 PAS domain-containing protein [Phycisphaerae bacterium]
MGHTPEFPELQNAAAESGESVRRSERSGQAEEQLQAHAKELRLARQRLAEAQRDLERLEAHLAETSPATLAGNATLEDQLEASEARLKLAQAAAGVGSWDVDLQTREIRWSDEQFQLLGLEPGSVQPSYEVWRACLHPQDRDSVAIDSLCRDDVNTVSLEYRVTRPDGQVRWLSSRGKVLRDRQDQRVRMVGVTIDITESKETHRRLEELNEALVQRTREAEQRSEQLRVLATQLTQAENRERRRLALLMHDHLQQLLIAARMKIGAIAQVVREDRAATWVRQAAQLLDESIAASRSLSVELSPPMLYESGLGAALDWLAQQMEEKHGLRVDVQASDEPEDEDIRVFLFQCVRELLFNVVKHAQVPQAEVRVKRLDEDRIIITVSDRGKGFDLAKLQERWAKGDSFGLRSVHERLGLLGGSFEIRTAPGEGMEARLIAPIRGQRAYGRSGSEAGMAGALREKI